MGLKCPLCKDAKILRIDKENVAEHLIITKDHQNHTHVHGPTDNKAVMQHLVLVALKEAGIDYSFSSELPAESAPKEETEKED